MSGLALRNTLPLITVTVVMVYVQQELKTSRTKAGSQCVLLTSAEETYIRDHVWLVCSKGSHLHQGDSVMKTRHTTTTWQYLIDRLVLLPAAMWQSVNLFFWKTIGESSHVDDEAEEFNGTRGQRKIQTSNLNLSQWGEKSSMWF